MSLSACLTQGARKQKGPHFCGPSVLALAKSQELMANSYALRAAWTASPSVHFAHAAAVAARNSGFLLLFRNFRRNQRFGQYDARTNHLPGGLLFEIVRSIIRE